MFYSIGEVATSTGLSVSTLRYYDKEGLFPAMERSSGGVRQFGARELDIIKMIECLKSTGMSIQEIKRFFAWCQEGDSSLQNRLDMFQERRAAVTEQMAVLQRTMNVIEYKCWYYTTAVAAGTESAVTGIPHAEIPAEIQRCKADFL